MAVEGRLMRKITEDRFALIQSIHPAAKIEVRDGVEVAVLREYDIESDIVREIIAGEIVRDGSKPKFAPGDVLHPGEPNECRIVDPFDPATWFTPVRKRDDGEGEPV
jgi:hypothetical protein